MTRPRCPASPALRAVALTLMIVLPVALWACPGGDLTLPRDGAPTQWPDMATGVDTGLSWPDAVQVNLDGSISAEASADLAPAADNGPLSDAQLFLDGAIPGEGGPCPCQAPLLCVGNVCRAQCNAPTDPCKVVSNCPPTYGCIPYAGGPKHVCMPAAGPGQPCGNGVAFCAVNYVCGSYNQGPYRCVPICSPKGGSCGTGGTCLESNGCLFCSHP